VKIGDFVCSTRDDPTKSYSRIYQIVEIKPYSNSTRAPSITAYMIFDYSCNPDPRWGSGSLSCGMDQVTLVPEMVLVARAASGQAFASRPPEYERLGVWTREDRDFKVWGKRYP